MKNQKQPSTHPNKKQIEPILSDTEIASVVKILLPESLSQNLALINKPLITQYLLNKILSKKVKNGMKFTALYLGKEESFEIRSVGTGEKAT